MLNYETVSCYILLASWEKLQFDNQILSDWWYIITFTMASKTILWTFHWLFACLRIFRLKVVIQLVLLHGLLLLRLMILSPKMSMNILKLRKIPRRKVMYDCKQHMVIWTLSCTVTSLQGHVKTSSLFVSVVIIMD